MSPRPVMEKDKGTGGRGRGMWSVRRTTRRIVYGTASKAMIMRSGRKSRDKIELEGDCMCSHVKDWFTYKMGWTYDARKFSAARSATQ